MSSYSVRQQLGKVQLHVGDKPLSVCGRTGSPHWSVDKPLSVCGRTGSPHWSVDKPLSVCGRTGSPHWSVDKLVGTRPKVLITLVNYFVVSLSVCERTGSPHWSVDKLVGTRPKVLITLVNYFVVSFYTLNFNDETPWLLKIIAQFCVATIQGQHF